MQTFQCYDYENEKEIEFSISNEFFEKVMNGWAEEDAKKGSVENPELYIKGRTGSLMDAMINRELDDEVYSNLFETAKEHGEVLKTKSLE